MKPLISIFVLAAALVSQAHAGAREDVLAAFEKTQAQKSYRATIASDSNAVQSQIDVQLPGSFHMTNPESEVIVMPAGSWMKTGGQWMKLPMDMSKMVQGMTLRAMRDGANSVQDVKELGSETIAGCEATKYGYRSEGKIMGVEASADVELAICSDTGLPVRIVSTDLKRRGRTTVTYDYSAAIDIHAPNGVGL